MKRGVGLMVLVLGAVVVTIGAAQVYPPRWYEEQPETEGFTGPSSLVLADGHLQFPDGTLQKTAPGSGESLGATPDPSLVLAEGGIEFPDGTVQTTAAGSLVARTGQTLCFDEEGFAIDCAEDIGPGQDGHLRQGAPWPNPRFTINESSPGVPDGTVTDNLTGLIWLANANCAGATMNWADALAFANTLFDGSTAHSGGDCGLLDGSLLGEWRLANLRELQSLVHYGVYLPAVPNTVGSAKWAEDDPFSSVQTAFYWSSTSSALYTPNAWAVSMGDGHLSVVNKLGTNPYVWPVRGGQ